jgi:hypothetical protein
MTPHNVRRNVLAVLQAARICELKMAVEEVAQLTRPPAAMPLPSADRSGRRRLLLLLAAERRRSARLVKLLLQ